MQQKHARKPRPSSPARSTVTATSPVCQVVHAAEGDRVQRFPTEDEIRLSAYLRWEAAGKPHGDGLEFWLEAERTLGGFP